MTVKPAKWNEWKVLKEHGDIEKIVELSKEMYPDEEDPNKPGKGISRITIGGALRTKRMNEKTYEVINKFYKIKKSRQDRLQKQRKFIQLETD